MTPIVPAEKGCADGCGQTGSSVLWRRIAPWAGLQTMHKFGRYTILIVSIALFLVSLTQDAFYIEGPTPRAWASAFYLLLLGWLGLLSGTIAWFANPLVIAAWVLFALRRYWFALALGVAASFCALSFLNVDSVVVSEAPSFAKITGFGLGYWLWAASMVATTIGCALALAGLVRDARGPTQTASPQ
jgi:hypothetical protein